MMSLTQYLSGSAKGDCYEFPLLKVGTTPDMPSDVVRVSSWIVMAYPPPFGLYRMQHAEEDREDEKDASLFILLHPALSMASQNQVIHPLTSQVADNLSWWRGGC